MSILQAETRTLEGEAASLGTYQGKVLLVVNVASACGLTPQYAGLEQLQQRFQAQGFSVLGFPSNEFGGQEPGSSAEIREFCETRFQVSFPLFEKVQTQRGPGQSEVYARLDRALGVLPNWNFGKYLIARDGRVLEFFPPTVPPEDPGLLASIQAALAASA